MALGSLPPWLNITPSQFLAATEAGTNAGQRIAEAAQRAWEEDQRMRMTQAQQAIENAAQRLAAERLEQYRRGELANAQARLGIEQQGLGLRGRGLDIEQAHNQDLLRLGEERNKSTAEREADRLKQLDFMNEMRQRDLDRREKDAERSRQGHFFTGPDGKTYVVQPGQTEATEVGLPKPKEAESGHETLNSLKRLGRSALDNFNVLGLHPFMSVNQPPPPTPAGQTNAAPHVPLSPTNAPPLSKRRVKVKGPSGQTGTIVEGDDLPEGWKLAE